MENYCKGKNVEESIERDNLPIRDLPTDFLWMQVKGGSKMSNLLSHSAGILEDKASTAVVWTGAGTAIGKAISCAEILKSQFAIEHQVTKLVYKKVEEHWEPKLEGLETIVVKRQIPVIHILLSLNPILDTSQLGYQCKEKPKFWESSSQLKKQTQKPKRHFKHKSKPNLKQN